MLPAAVENAGGALEGRSGQRSVQRGVEASSVSGFSASSPFSCYMWSWAPAGNAEALAVPRFGNALVPASGTAHLLVLHILVLVEVERTLEV